MSPSGTGVQNCCAKWQGDFLARPIDSRCAYAHFENNCHSHRPVQRYPEQWLRTTGTHRIHMLAIDRLPRNPRGQPSSRTRAMLGLDCRFNTEIQIAKKRSPKVRIDFGGLISITMGPAFQHVNLTAGAIAGSFPIAIPRDLARRPYLGAKSIEYCSQYARPYPL